MSWFVVNVRDADWFRNQAFGASALYQPPDVAPQLGINIGVLEPGSLAQDTHDPEVAYAGFPPYEPASRPPGPWDS